MNDERSNEIEVAYAELLTGACPDGIKHRVFLALAGGDHAAQCVRCGAYADDVPASEYENI